jgi:ATP-dependent RNA helicase RhlE
VTIEVARSNATASTVEQHFYRVEDDDKRLALKQILNERGVKQAFVFVNSKLGCARLARSLEREGLVTTALHGDKSQDERLKALEAFKSGAVDLLVCTDVAARGLDIKDVPAVFNFDIPFNAEDYVHRIGRTGRAGASGLAVSFVGGRDAKMIGDLEKLIAKKIEIEPFELASERRAPTGRFNDGQRAWRDPSTATAAPARAPRVAKPSADPLFDKPYEPSAASGAAPAWETTPATSSRSALSPNIKPRKKVAALFKVAEPAQVPSGETEGA